MHLQPPHAPAVLLGEPQWGFGRMPLHAATHDFVAELELDRDLDLDLTVSSGPVWNGDPEGPQLGPLDPLSPFQAALSASFECHAACRFTHSCHHQPH